MKVHVTKKRQIRYALDNFAKKYCLRQFCQKIRYALDNLEIRDFQQYHMTLRQVQETKFCNTSVETDTDKLLERSMLLSNMEY